MEWSGAPYRLTSRTSAMDSATQTIGGGRLQTRRHRESNIMAPRALLQRIVIATVFMVGVLGGTSAFARTISYATGYPPNSIGSDSALAYADALKELSGGDLSVKVFPMSLLSFSEASPGIRDGMADSGFVLFSYFPSEFPNTNLIAELTMLLELDDVAPSHAGLAYVGAMSEYLFHHCPECVEEFAAQNQVFTGASASAPYMMLCNKEVTSLADIKGKRLRSAGPQWARWAQAVGGTPVTISVSDAYEALNQGVLDCSISSSVDLDIFRLSEVVSDVTAGVPGGVFGGTGVNNFNRKVWQGLSEAQREQVLRASATFGAIISWDYQVGAARELEAAPKQEIKVHEPAGDLQQESHRFIVEDMKTIARNYQSRSGVDNAEQSIKAFQPILSKWVKLVKEVSNPEELAEIYWRETYSKVDVSEYSL